MYTLQRIEKFFSSKKKIKRGVKAPNLVMVDFVFKITKNQFFFNKPLGKNVSDLGCAEY